MQETNVKFVPGREAQTPLPEGISGTLAIPWVALTRHKPGGRLLSWGMLLLTVLLLLFMQGIGAAFSPYTNPLHRYDVAIFSVVVLLLGSGKKLLGMHRLKRGDDHSYSHGSSYFLPGLRKDLANAFADPLLALGAGVALYHFHFRLLGVWLVLTCAALFRVEVAAFFEQRKRQFDLLDSHAESRLLQENIGGTQPVAISAAPNRARSRVGLPTSLDDQLKARIRNRK